MANKTVTVKPGGGGDYTSLNAALAAEATDLVANTRILTIECYGGATADTTAASTGSGYTTSSSYYINITVPSAERHAGTWNTAKYRLTITGSTNKTALAIGAEYTRVDGLQISVSIDAFREAFGINCSVNNGLRVTNCIFKDIYDSGYNSYGTAISFSRNALVYNNVIYNCGTHAIWEASGFGSACYIYNNTIYNVGLRSNSYNGIKVDASTSGECRNNIVIMGSGAGTAYAIGGLTGSNNGGSDTSGDIDNMTAADLFASTTGGAEDLSLKSGADAIDQGADLSGTFTTDITGATRSGTWDIGAFEYVASAGSILMLVSQGMHNAQHLDTMRG